jgi:hypothetical protein
MGCTDRRSGRRCRARRPQAALAALGLSACVLPGFAGESARTSLGSPQAHAQWELISRYCFECHYTTDWAGGVAFDTMSFNSPEDANVWEAAVRKLRAEFMPPPSAKARPDPRTVNDLVWTDRRSVTAPCTPREMHSSTSAASEAPPA